MYIVKQSIANDAECSLPQIEPQVTPCYTVSLGFFYFYIKKFISIFHKDINFKKTLINFEIYIDTK